MGRQDDRGNAGRTREHQHPPATGQHGEHERDQGNQGDLAGQLHPTKATRGLDVLRPSTVTA